MVWNHYFWNAWTTSKKNSMLTVIHNIVVKTSDQDTLTINFAWLIQGDCEISLVDPRGVSIRNTISLFMKCIYYYIWPTGVRMWSGPSQQIWKNMPSKIHSITYLDFSALWRHNFALSCAIYNIFLLDDCIIAKLLFHKLKNMRPMCTTMLCCKRAGFYQGVYKLI